MGFFTNTPSAQPAGLQPLTRERIEAVLKSWDFDYGIDDDGDIMTGFEHGFYWLVIGGKDDEILSVRGRWRGYVQAADQEEVRRMADEWNRTQIWPKTFLDVSDEDGDALAFADLSVDYQPGVSDEQIEQHIRCAMGSSESFFETLKVRFPEVAASYEEE